MEDEELMGVLSNRKKRSPGRGRGMPNQRRGGFDLEPPVYGRQRNGVLSVGYFNSNVSPH